jgi:hypothetical protein
MKVWHHLQVSSAIIGKHRHRSDLTGMTNGLKFLKRIGYSNIDTHLDDGSAFFYEAGLTIDADGAPHAYHPNEKSGLDYLSNAWRPGNWWALVTDNAKPSGRPIIQGANDPAPGFYMHWLTSWEFLRV